MATAIENTALASKMEIDNLILTEPKVAMSLLHPPVLPGASTTHIESDTEGTTWCGLRKVRNYC